MPRRVSMLSLVAVLALASTSLADELGELERQQQSLYKQVSPAVVYIVNSKGIGSGFFVRENLIVTNAHVVGDDSKVDIVTLGGKKLRGRVIARAPERVDLALLEVSYKSAAVLKLGSEKLSIGSWVASVGHGVDSPWSYTTGMVSNIFKKKRRRPVFQTQIPLNPGNSGGPIFDRRGEVIGVVTSGIQSSNSVNFAIHSAEVIKAFPEYLGKSCACILVQAPAGAAILIDGDYAGLGPSLLLPVTRGTHEITASINGKIRLRSVQYPKVKQVDFRPQ